MKIGYLNSIIQKIPIKKACQGYYLRWYYNGWHYWFFLPGNIVTNTDGENYRTIGTRKISMCSGQVTYEQINALRTIRNSKEIQLLTIDGWMNIRLEPGSVIVKNNYINGYEFDFIAIVGSREGYYSPVVDVPETIVNQHAITITHHNTGVFIMILTGNGDITIDWGDGSPPETFTLTDDPLVITHDYSGTTGEHVIIIEGEEHIITLSADGQHITEITIPPTATSLTGLYLPNNEITVSPDIPDTVPLTIMDLTGNPLIICEVVIGIQVWMCKNYDSDYPGSKVYNDNESYRLVYGGLYSWNQIIAAGFCPSGWHVPTLAEWQTSITFLGGIAIAGGHLKETLFSHWFAPNTGADNTSGFTALPTGYYNIMSGFIGLGYYTKLWTLTKHPTIEVAYAMQLAYNSAGITNNYEDKQHFCPVRLLKNFVSVPSPFGILTDYDGNICTYITIGTQQWIVQNLRTTHYADGTVIPHLTLAVDWAAEDGTGGHDGAYCAYNNDVLNIPDYGLLYNWYAVDNAHGLAYFKRNGVFEAGWRVPDDTDINTLTTFLGGSIISGGKLKQTGLTHWDAPNTGATNDYGFNMFGGGLRSELGVFDFLHIAGYLWKTVDTDADHAHANYMANISAALVGSTARHKTEGFSIRCMRDLP